MKNRYEQHVLSYEVKPILRFDEEKELVWRHREEQRNLDVKNISETLGKMPSICCELACYNRKLSLNNSITLFS